jgi:hypothetical protein
MVALYVIVVLLGFCRNPCAGPWVSMTAGRDPAAKPQTGHIPWSGRTLSLDAARISCIHQSCLTEDSSVGQRRGRSLPESHPPGSDRQAFDVPGQGWRPAHSYSPLSADNQQPRDPGG